jgi:hypothetical protein
MSTSYLPAPEQLCLVKMSEVEVADEIERHIDFVDKTGRSVHLPTKFVRHFMKRDDGLPVVVAIAQLPIMLADGSILAMREGLDRDRGIVFRIPQELMNHLPERAACTPTAVANAMRFLCDEWLCDVSTDYAGKCILIADALTLIERNLLPDRPVFFITAGRRGGGKTTTLHMLIMAVFGARAAAAAWSTNEEERRKAILSYFMSGVAYIIWDNISRGTQIGCPHIERSCTTKLYTDRKLGVSETVATAASTIHHFTGNNIGPKGDSTSRSLVVRLEVDRADPENRSFRHNDPIGWTEAHRGQIMNALYTVLLGNPFLRTPLSAECQTRFKVWWRLVGSAVEHAAEQHSTCSVTSPACPPQKIAFKDLFLRQEEDDEESSSLTDALAALSNKWPDAATFTASNVATMVNDRSEFSATPQQNQILREFLFPEAPPSLIATSVSIGKRLHRHLGEPVARDGRTLVLKSSRPVGAGPNGTLLYFVQVSGDEVF